MSPSTAVAVMARAPMAGQVKQRLAAEIGDNAATAIYAAMLQDSVALAVRAVTAINTFIYHTQDVTEESESQQFSLSDDIQHIPQCEGDIGCRMLHALNTLPATPKKLLIGSDAPDIPLHHFELAIDALETYDLVLGPAEDGGFYLIGASRALSETLFNKVRWSSQSTLAEVLANANSMQLSVCQLPKWRDVDEIADLHALAQRLQNGTGRAQYTRRVLALYNLLQQ